MWRLGLVFAGAVIVVGQSITIPAIAQQQVTLNVVTAGDQNMLDYVTDYLGPMFQKDHPGVTVHAVGTGPGDAGSQKIYGKLDAEKNNQSWDVDVAVIHQKAAGNMVTKGMLAKYVPDVPTGKLATTPSAKEAVGTDVAGYVIPMFNSQTVIAYNTMMVKDPPKTYAELIDWVKANPGKFGYNGIKGEMSGVAFVIGWIYASSPDPKKLMNGPYDPDLKNTWTKALADLVAFNKNVVMTPGNAGTLDMLNRGEIAMGPVWVDMFYDWQNDGKIPPTVKLALIGPGMPGQPMYYGIPANATNGKLAEDFISLATSPEVQAEGIVKRFNWYSGIDPNAVRAQLDDATWQKLFVDVTPQDLETKGQPFPITPYFNEILEAYEKSVQ